MVLEWLEGMPLEGVLERERASGLPLRSLEQTVRLLDPVAEALALAHKKGIAHRDVKPANVFVLGDPRGDDTGVKLLDFGIAKVVQDAQKMGFGKTAGHITSFTPAYGAPEQFNRAYGATGPWTDVFALALVTVEVLTGREPLAGDTVVQLAYAASDPKTRPTPRTFGVHVTDEVEAVFQKALAVKPEERYPTAGELWNALRTVAIGQAMASMTSESVRPAGAHRVPSGRGITGAEVAETALAPMLTTGPAPSGATAPATPTAAPGSQPRSLAPIVVGVVAVVALAGAAGVVALRGKAPGRGDATSGSPTTGSAIAAASASPVVGACPPGMKRITGGHFFMGSDEKDAEPNEKPPHNVQIAPYCLDELEVTVAQYKACSDTGSCLRASKENFWTGITPAESKIYDPICNARDPVGRANHPINCVSWEQARTYCESRGARLPTEAEWELAARGSDGRIYPWGDEPPSAQLLNACGKECVAWMKKNPDPNQPIAAMYEEDDGFPSTAPVGSFPKGKSSWGIQDIAGNVWEWVADWYAPYDPASDKTMTVDPKGPASGTERVLRGGAWNGAKPAWVRPSWRFRVDPAFRTHGIGFRCAKTL
jgi:formylglycine-generating enzyme required for sulfatase activity